MRWLGVLVALTGVAALVVDVGVPAAQTAKPSGAAAPAATKPSADAQARQLSLGQKPWTGDFHKMLDTFAEQSALGPAGIDTLINNR